jgi:hypothetical protein
MRASAEMLFMSGIERAALPHRGKGRGLIALSDVDQRFSYLVVNELAKGLGLATSADLTRFAQSVRNDARLFIQAKARPNNPQLRAVIKRLYVLNNRALRGDREAQQLARAVASMHSDVRHWLVRCNPDSREIPTAAEITDVQTRGNAVDRLRLVLGYGCNIKRDGRKRPSGKRSRSVEPLLRIPGIERNPKTGHKNNEPLAEFEKEGRPRAVAEREFIRHLSLTYLEMTGYGAPYCVNSEDRVPFSNFVHRCFELVGAPQGHVTRLINEAGGVRRAADNATGMEYPEDADPFWMGNRVPGG